MPVIGNPTQPRSKTPKKKRKQGGKKRWAGTQANGPVEIRGTSALPKSPHPRQRDRTPLPKSDTEITQGEKGKRMQKRKQGKRKRDSKIHSLDSTLLSASLALGAFILEHSVDVAAEEIDIGLQTRLHPVLHPVLAGGRRILVFLAWALVFLALRVPGVDFGQQLLDRGHAGGVKVLELGHVDGDADAAGAGVDDKGALEQMVEFLADFGVEAWVRVFEPDVLFGIDEAGRGEGGEGARFGEGVDVIPFLARGARGLAVPFLLQGAGQRFVGDQGEEVCALFGGLPRVLIAENAGFEIGIQDFKAASIGKGKNLLVR